ncbi:MAG: LysM domain/BON superfamily protein [Chthoniobacteraceae bacterium]|nr:LysM domain/BON superfamily protein [Chthoniobacteraceae bacterium]
MTPRNAAALGLAIAALSMAGCDRLFEKDTKTVIASAEKKVTAGDFRGAVRLYESALDGTPKTVDVHYWLAIVYDDKLKSPLDALHHFRRYLEMAPAGKYAREAKAYQKEGELKLLTSLSTGTFVSQEEAVRIKNENLKLVKTLAELRAQKNVVLPAGVAKGEMVRKPIPPNARTHIVASGETLASIAVKYYKNKAKWQTIQNANFYGGSGAAKIKPGQELIIP